MNEVIQAICIRSIRRLKKDMVPKELIDEDYPEALERKDNWLY